MDGLLITLSVAGNQGAVALLLSAGGDPGLLLTDPHRHQLDADGVGDTADINQPAGRTALDMVPGGGRPKAGSNGAGSERTRSWQLLRAAAAVEAEAEVAAAAAVVAAAAADLDPSADVHETGEAESASVGGADEAGRKSGGVEDDRRRFRQGIRSKFEL